MVNSEFRNNRIGYHPYAVNTQITHLSIVDDIMIFVYGEKDSLVNIASTLDTFSVWSVLSMNRSKTYLFVAGLNQEETSDISSLAFSLGSMPVRYLGLPLMHRKLWICDYRPLIYQLKRRFSSWTSSALSYAGRRTRYAQLSLRQSTFGFHHSFFQKVVLLLSLRCVQGSCGTVTYDKAVAKESWNSVCLPKMQGGLGIRILLQWKKILTLKFV